MKKFLLASLLFVGSVTCRAQYSYTGTGSGAATINTIQNISLTSLINISNFNSANDYQNGITTNNYATIAIKSNTPWIVSVVAQSAFFNALTQGASANMPASILGIRVTGSTNFTTISTTSSQLKTGNRGNASTSGNTFNVDLKFSPGFNYKGGQYNINLVYTLTSS